MEVRPQTSKDQILFEHCKLKDINNQNVLPAFFSIGESSSRKKRSKLTFNLMEIKLKRHIDIDFILNSVTLNDQRLMKMKSFTYEGLMNTFAKF